MSTEPSRVPIVRYQDVLWAIEASVMGRVGLFLLDTAAGLTTLDASFASGIDREPFGRFSGHRMSGERVDVERLSDVVVEIGGRAIPRETVGVTDLAAFLPADWPPVAGGIGLDLFEDGAITIDFAEGVLSLETEESLAARTPEMVPLLARVARTSGLALDVFVAARTAPGLLWFEVDSGNTGPAILAPHAAELLGVPEGTEDPVPIDLVGLGPTPVRAVVKDIIYDGNLGQAFLDGRVLTLDLARSRAWVGAGS